MRNWVRHRGIKVRIARKGIESSDRLGKNRWVIERTIAWLFGYRRLNVRYERKANHFFLHIGIVGLGVASVLPRPLAGWT